MPLSLPFTGLANAKTIDIQPGSKNEVVITTSKPKNASKPVSSKHSYTTKKSSRRASSSIGREVKRLRPDLQVSVSPSMLSTSLYSYKTILPEPGLELDCASSAKKACRGKLDPFMYWALPLFSYKAVSSTLTAI